MASQTTYQDKEEELLPRNARMKLVGESVLSIKSRADGRGQTRIKIETKNYKVVLEANDLGAWFKKLKGKKFGAT